MSSFQHWVYLFGSRRYMMDYNLCPIHQSKDVPEDLNDVYVRYPWNRLMFCISKPSVYVLASWSSWFLFQLFSVSETQWILAGHFIIHTVCRLKGIISKTCSFTFRDLAGFGNNLFQLKTSSSSVPWVVLIGIALYNLIAGDLWLVD